MPKPIRTNQRDARGLMAQRTAFIASALTAETHPYHWTPMTGRLPREWRERLTADIEAALGRGGVYIVWSYGTPIAWVVGDVVTIPDVKYSVTTSKHQSTVRFALRELAVAA